MSDTKYIACIDAGTTGCRTIIFSERGTLITQAYEEYTSIFRSPTWIDHDPSTWLQARKIPFNTHRTISRRSERHRRHLRDFAASDLCSGRR